MTRQEATDGERPGEDRDGRMRSVLLVAPLALLAISPFLFIAATVEPTESVSTGPSPGPSASIAWTGTAPPTLFPAPLEPRALARPERSGFVLPIERTSLLAVIIDRPRSRDDEGPPIGRAAGARSTPVPPPSTPVEVMDIDEIDGFNVDYPD